MRIAGQRQTGGTYYYCQPGWKKYSLPPVDAIAYWDEANRIPLFLLLTSLWRARCLNATIVVATHDDLSQIASLCGLMVKTITLNTLCTDNLLEWAKKLIEAERLSPSIPINLQLTADRAKKIVLMSQNSWRKAANYLHIWAAEIASR
ncbi:hypothetical protein ACOWPH_28605 (plasmid) [Anabaena sp. PCC 7938]|uniref:Uncharacterized protein n=2 Tax=Anabaena TaxID=1163 RepID=K9ZSD3_ANACC|nr:MULTISPECIES: hypothetical protein [Anabaena]AFZ61260.1 hypothetical protein Anacy_5977 [Anabaena cylindrica PCC 7122]MCM2409312.1 hypothetical protein [Anabaena sp. CCAP 1446/1C]BAY06785.1 hypothetical protein NIES19_60680 [Anabaena cylindrica PCC 7122]